MIFVSKRALHCWALVAVISMLSACATVQKGVDGIVSVFDQDGAKPVAKSGQPAQPKAPSGDAPKTSPKPATSPAAAPARATSADELLAAGVRQYEDARYPEAAELLKSSLARDCATAPVRHGRTSISPSSIASASVKPPAGSLSTAPSPPTRRSR